MRPFLTIASCALAIGLAACGPSGNSDSVALPGGASITTSGSGDSALTTLKGANGEVVQFGASDAAAKASLPDFLTLFPGAKVTANISAPDTNNDRKTGSVAFGTSASVAEVIAFYKQKAVAQGLEEQLMSSTPDGTTYMANKDKMMVQVIASKGTDGTEALLTWTAPK